MRVLLRILPLAVLAAALTACGSSSSSKLAKGDVAVVGTTHITQPQLDHEIAIVIANLKANKHAVPSAGSAGYKSEVIDASVQQLVFSAEVRAIAAQLKVTVSDSLVRSDITKFIKQSYQGKVAKYTAALKKFGLTGQDVFDNVQLSELEKAIGRKLAAETRSTTRPPWPTTTVISRPTPFPRIRARWTTSWSIPRPPPTRICRS